MAINFSLDERRILGLEYMRTDFEDPESKALRKIIDTIPWILKIAECEFDERVTYALLQMEADKIKLHEAVAYFQAKRQIESRKEPASAEVKSE